MHKKSPSLALRGFGQRQLAIVRIKGLFDDGEILLHEVRLLQQQKLKFELFLFTEE